MPTNDDHSNDFLVPPATYDNQRHERRVHDLATGDLPRTSQRIDPAGRYLTIEDFLVVQRTLAPLIALLTDLVTKSLGDTATPADWREAAEKVQPLPSLFEAIAVNLAGGSDTDATEVRPQIGETAGQDGCG